MKLGKDTMIALIRNKKKLQGAVEEYREAHENLVDQHTLKDDDGNPIYPTTEHPETGEEVEDKSGDPLFDDKTELVAELNDLLQSDAEVKGLKTISVYDLPDNAEALGTHAEILSFMIPDLYDDEE
jgi:hypothetical protein